MEPDKPEHKTIASQPAGSEQMTPPRKFVVLVLLAVLFVGHGYCVLFNEEHWPFSRYPMYSVLHQPTWTDEFLVGTLRDNPDQQIPISYFVYDRPISVKTSLDHLAQRMEEDPDHAEDLRLALVGLGKIYLDKRGGHRPDDFQDISALSLIKVSWMIPPGEGHEKALETKRQVVMEVQLPADSIATVGEEAR